MRINSIQISNAYNFKYYDSIDDVQKITFNDENKLNYFIGPNGSGKTNFIKIIVNIIKNYISPDYKIDDNTIQNLFQNEQFNIHSHNKHIKRAQGHTLKIPKHRHSKDKAQTILIEIEATSSDIKNIEYIKNTEDYIDIFKLTTLDKATFIDLIDINNINKNLKLRYETTNSNYTLECNLLEGDPKLLKYFNNFHYIYEASDLYRLKNQTSKFENCLVDNKIFISATRSNEKVSNQSLEISLKDSMQVDFAMRYDLKRENFTSFNDDIFLRHALLDYAKIYSDIQFSSEKNEHYELFSNNQEYKRLQKNIKNILGYKIEYKYTGNKSYDKSYTIILSENGAEFGLEDLSSGEKELFRLIMILCSKRFKDSIIFIDEPELHLHPSSCVYLGEFIEECVDIANEDSKDIQLFINTHSPAFINEKTFKNVYKFTSTAKEIVRCSENIFQSQKDLISIINYTNINYLFFKRYLILVEGLCDQIFFNFYIKHTLQANNIDYKIYDYATIPIGGKSNLKKWKTLLDTLKIPYSAIVDFDNIINFEFKPYKNLLDNKENDKIDQKRLIEYRKNNDPYLQSIDSKIESMYKENIFILKYGDLESYTGTSGKDKVSNIIRFCEHFDKNEKNFKNQNKSKDFNDIIDKLIENMSSSGDV